MGEKSYRLSANVCALPAADADKLISAGDGDSALLYIYLLRRGEAPDAELAAALGEVIKLSERQVAMMRNAGPGEGLLVAGGIVFDDIFQLQHVRRTPLHDRIKKMIADKCEQIVYFLGSFREN